MNGAAPLAVVDNVNTASPALYHVHADHLDRPVMMTSSTKAAVWEVQYRPFGEVSAVTGTATLNLRFPGQWYQLEAGLAYNWHRHDDATLGRYLHPDPLGFVDGPSVYGYAKSSPQQWVDFRGLDVAVIINNNGIGHAGIYVGNPIDGNQIYDPGGSYKPRQRGSGDTIDGGDADLDDYIRYQRTDGPNVRVFKYSTTLEQDREILRAIDRQGGCSGGLCAVCTGDVLRASTRFKNLSSSPLNILPWGLARSLGNLK